MCSFYAPICKTDCLQTLYKFAKTEFSYRIQCISWHYRCVVNTVAVISKMLKIAYTPLSRRKRLQNNDVSLVLSRSSWVRSRTREHAYRRPCLTVFWEIWTPKCCRLSRGPQKTHFLSSPRVFWTIVRKITCAAYFSRRVQEKLKKRGFIIHIFRQALPYGRLAQILGHMFVLWTLWIVQRFIVIGYGFRILRAVEIWPFPLYCDVVVNTVWTTVYSVIVIFAKTKLSI